LFQFYFRCNQQWELLGAGITHLTRASTAYIQSPTPHNVMHAPTSYFQAPTRPATAHNVMHAPTSYFQAPTRPATAHRQICNVNRLNSQRAA